ncbi:MAG TPA: YdcF family protein [Terriglobia bacterium]|nr:YdcF family protein [Terriglobia bacterium]
MLGLKGTRQRTGRRWLILLAVLALLAGSAFWAFRKVGRWLVAPDALQHARAIVVLSGRLPFRAMEAADLYRQGWAPEVWLFRDETDEADAAFARLGIPHPSEEEYDQQVLMRLGVPAAAIRILEPPTTNTVSEAKLIAEELRRQGGDKAILMTSPLHTRRVKTIWRLVVGDHPQAILRYDSSEPSDPDHWWRATQDVEAVVHELLGLVNAYLGFVAEPRKR